MMNVIMRQMEKMAEMELSITAVGTVGQKEMCIRDRLQRVSESCDLGSEQWNFI